MFKSILQHSIDPPQNWCRKKSQQIAFVLLFGFYFIYLFTCFKSSANCPIFHIAFHIHILVEQLNFSPQLRSSPQRAISSGKKEDRIPPEGGDECLMSSTQSRATEQEPRACSLGALFAISVLYSRHKATNRLVEWLMGARSQSLFNTRTHGSFIIPHQPNA